MDTGPVFRPTFKTASQVLSKFFEPPSPLWSKRDVSMIPHALRLELLLSQLAKEQWDAPEEEYPADPVVWTYNIHLKI